MTSRPASTLNEPNSCGLNRNVKIRAAQDNMEAVEAMFAEINSRSVTREEGDSLRKVTELAKEMREFVEEAGHLLRSDNIYMSSVMPQKSPKLKGDTALEEPLMSQYQIVDVKEVVNQYDKVEQRHEDIVQLHGRTQNVKDVTQNMLNVTVENDLKLGNIVKHQMDHERRVEQEINPQFVKTKEIQSKMFKKLCCFGSIAVTLAIFVLLLLYLVLRNKEDK